MSVSWNNANKFFFFFQKELTESGQWFQGILNDNIEQNIDNNRQRRSSGNEKGKRKNERDKVFSRKFKKK